MGTGGGGCWIHGSPSGSALEFRTGIRLMPMSGVPRPAGRGCDGAANPRPICPATAMDGAHWELVTVKWSHSCLPETQRQGMGVCGWVGAADHGSGVLIRGNEGY
jgi:hypothetical protein